MGEIFGKLLDTNTVIAFRAQDEEILRVIDEDTIIYLSVVVIGELYYGAYNSARTQENLESLEMFISENQVLQISHTVSKLFGRIRAQLKQKGRPIPENDIWIAATALQYDLTLITRDKHFAHIENLTTEGW